MRWALVLELLVLASVMMGCGGGAPASTPPPTTVGNPPPVTTPPPPPTAVTTSTSLTADLNPAPLGAKVTFTAAVNPAPSAGTITFMDGSTQLGTAQLSVGAASFSTTTLSMGSHSVTAVYAGDETHKTSTSTALVEVVNPASSVSTLAAQVTPTPTGSNVTLTATVTPASSTGTVTFKDGANLLATVALDSSGKATFSTSALSIGSHRITADYSGDATHTKSTSFTTFEVKSLSSTSTTLTANPNPGPVGGNITLTASVTPGTSIGTVTFNEGGSALGQSVLNGGVAQFSTNTLSTGPHTLTAVYGGDSTHAGSTSAAVNEVVGPRPTDLRALNHIVMMLQENRSFDHYFGGLNAYRVKQGLPASLDIATSANSNRNFDNTKDIFFYKLNTVCTEAPSPSWNESHVDYNRFSSDKGPGLNDGFVRTAAGDSRDDNAAGVTPKANDIEGVRAMGYYTENELPYYYFMATAFATSDRFFSPTESRTLPNRLYLFAATSAGHAYQPQDALTSKTIFEELDNANISWKIYAQTGLDTSYFSNFTYSSGRQNKVVPFEQYFADLRNGTLPAVSLIESESGLDEHPNSGIQTGAKFAATFINAFMGSSAWQDGVFLLSYDEGGGYYDHVPSPPAVHPDGIRPIDLFKGDLPGDFDRYGFRLPLIVISPFTKKGYVSHTTSDYTAFLKLIETRYNLKALTNRDAAQPDMTEFFDFGNPAWLTPPIPPDQPTDGQYSYDHLP